MRLYDEKNKALSLKNEGFSFKEIGEKINILRNSAIFLCFWE